RLFFGYRLDVSLDRVVLANSGCPTAGALDESYVLRRWAEPPSAEAVVAVRRVWVVPHVVVRKRPTLARLPRVSTDVVRASEYRVLLLLDAHLQTPGCYQRHTVRWRTRLNYGPGSSSRTRSLLWVKRTCRCAPQMSAYDPKRTSLYPFLNTCE